MMASEVLKVIDDPTVIKIYDELRATVLERAMLGKDNIDEIFELSDEFSKRLEQVFVMRLRPYHVIYVDDQQLEEALKEKVIRPTVIINLTNGGRFWLKIPERIISDPDTDRFLYKQPEQLITIVLNKAGGENQWRSFIMFLVRLALNS